jgi:tRNA-uridine 2-sulfurtransferase
MNSRKKVFVGMSGGVDSSVAALRLLREGYDVTGVFIKVWHPDFMVCNWEEERIDAMRVAAHLKIPFLTCDAVEAYKNDVADYFIESYRAGITPNPDVMCNKAVKFGIFRNFALSCGADFIATGHYVRKEIINGTASLLKGIDSNKDQSYFLWSLSQAQINDSLFPIGDTDKDKVRYEAKEANLPTATKKDSQGICFLGHVDIPDFLRHYINLIPGPVITEEGETIGEHQGAFVYTLGQRHGFTINDKRYVGTPYYVTQKNVEANTITVADTPPLLATKACIELSHVIFRTTIVPNKVYTAQFRYRQTPVEVLVTKGSGETARITLLSENEKPSIGQSCVLFDGVVCIGGGIIVT